VLIKIYFGVTKESKGVLIYESRLQISWTNLITQSRNIVEGRWRSLFRSISLGERCTTYNAPLTYWKRVPDRLSLRNFLPRSSIFMVGKAKVSHGARSELNSVFGLEKVENETSLGHPPYSPDLAPCNFWAFRPWKGSSESRNFEVINGLQHVFEKWVERCKMCIACQERYFEKRPSPHLHKVPTRGNK
jgi:hypothetical protein